MGFLLSLIYLSSDGKSIVYDIDGNVLLEKNYEDGIEGKNVESLSPKG